MSTSDGSRRAPPSLSTQAIQRAIWIVLAVLIASVMLFAGYYIWDRYIHLGDQSPAELGIQRMEEAVGQDPQNVEARLVLAEAYLAGGQYEKALEQVNQVLDTYPDNASALLIAGVCSVHLDRPEAALDPLQQFVAVRKDLPMAQADTLLEMAYYYLGDSYLKLGRPGEAIAVLEAALVINPVDADALYQAGLAYQASDQPEAALERYHKAVRLVPDFGEAYHGMVESYAALARPDHEAYARGMEAFSQRDYESALVDLERATGALPDFAPGFLGLGLAYEKMGQLEAALAAILRAMELNPDDFATQQAHGRIQAALNQQE